MVFFTQRHRWLLAVDKLNIKKTPPKLRHHNNVFFCFDNALSFYSKESISSDFSGYLLTYLLIQRSRVLLEKLTGSQPVKKFPAFYGTRWIITSSQYPTAVPILSQIVQVHAPESHFLKIHLNIVVPYMFGSYKWSLSLRFPHQNPIYTPLLFPIRATCPVHLILLGLITRTILCEEYRSLSSSVWSFLLSTVTSSILGPYHFLSTLFSNTFRLLSLITVTKKCVLTPIHLIKKCGFGLKVTGIEAKAALSAVTCSTLIEV